MGFDVIWGIGDERVSDLGVTGGRIGMVVTMRVGVGMGVRFGLSVGMRMAICLDFGHG